MCIFKIIFLVIAVFWAGKRGLAYIVYSSTYIVTNSYYTNGSVIIILRADVSKVFTMNSHISLRADFTLDDLIHDYMVYIY